ncbi:hypothetical protein SAMN05216183_1191, partial [Pseudooceanicola nitratireducens]
PFGGFEIDFSLFSDMSLSIFFGVR